MRILITRKFQKIAADFKIFPTFDTGQSELDQSECLRGDSFPEGPEEIKDHFGKKKKKKKKRKKLREQIK